MAQLKAKDREALAAEIFFKTGVPLSKEDPIFALVELLQLHTNQQQVLFSTTCDRAVEALQHATSHLGERSEAFKDVVDAYIQNRLESANTDLEIEMNRLRGLASEAVHEVQEQAMNRLCTQFSSVLETACIKPINDRLDLLPERSWMESIWTLAACLSIGFAVGLIYFNGTIRGPLESEIWELTRKLPSPTASSNH